MSGENMSTNIATFDPETAGNSEEIEMQFAVKTVEHLEAYEKLITSIPPKKLKLTGMDDDIYDHLIAEFPEFVADEALWDLDEDKMKSATGKPRWRKFIMSYEKTLTDYNFGTMLRRNAQRLYDEDNSILVTRAQFIAIEIARNRRGLNDKVFEQAQAAKRS